jgi:hypothetical protein
MLSLCGGDLERDKKQNRFKTQLDLDGISKKIGYLIVFSATQKERQAC